MNESTVYILYLLFALGGAAVYFLMPRPERNWTLVGSVFGVAAVIGFLVLLATRVVAPHESRWYFCFFAAIALLGASRVITHPRPVYSAIYFVMVVVATATCLCYIRRVPRRRSRHLRRRDSETTCSSSCSPSSPVRRLRPPHANHRGRRGVCTHGRVAVGRRPDPPSHATPSPIDGHDGDTNGSPTLLATDNTLAVGRVVMTKYVVALEIAGVLLLVSMVGRSPARRGGSGAVRPPLSGRERAGRSVYHGIRYPRRCCCDGLRFLAAKLVVISSRQVDVSGRGGGGGRLRPPSKTLRGRRLRCFCW